CPAITGEALSGSDLDQSRETAGWHKDRLHIQRPGVGHTHSTAVSHTHTHTHTHATAHMMQAMILFSMLSEYVIKDSLLSGFLMGFPPTPFWEKRILYFLTPLWIS